MAPRRDACGRLDPAPLRLVLVTDGQGDADRIERVVAAALSAGLGCVQLREPSWSDSQMVAVAGRLRPRLEAADGLLLINDRVELVAAGHAHGVHLGRRSIPLERARAALGTAAVLSFSAHDAGELDRAAVAGCDFASLSPVWPTTSKPGAAALGPTRAEALTAAAALPVVWLGGIGAQQAAVAAGSSAAGLAVRSALMTATDVGRTTAALLRPCPI